MKRVAVIGPGGAGKSRFARELAERTGLPVIHLDTLYWHPGWVPTPEDEWRAVHDELLVADRWIIDGNYGSTMTARLAGRGVHMASRATRRGVEAGQK